MNTLDELMRQPKRIQPYVAEQTDSPTWSDIGDSLTKMGSGLYERGVQAARATPATLRDLLLGGVGAVSGAQQWLQNPSAPSFENIKNTAGNVGAGVLSNINENALGFVPEGLVFGAAAAPGWAYDKLTGGEGNFIERAQSAKDAYEKFTKQFPVGSTVGSLAGVGAIKKFGGRVISKEALEKLSKEQQQEIISKMTPLERAVILDDAAPLTPKMVHQMSGAEQELLFKKMTPQERIDFNFEKYGKRGIVNPDVLYEGVPAEHRQAHQAQMAAKKAADAAARTEANTFDVLIHGVAPNKAANELAVLRESNPAEFRKAIAALNSKKTDANKVKMAALRDKFRNDPDAIEELNRLTAERYGPVPYDAKAVEARRKAKIPLTREQLAEKDKRLAEKAIEDEIAHEKTLQSHGIHEGHFDEETGVYAHTREEDGKAVHIFAAPKPTRMGNVARELPANWDEIENKFFGQNKIHGIMLDPHNPADMTYYNKLREIAATKGIELDDRNLPNNFIYVIKKKMFESEKDRRHFRTIAEGLPPL
jgi:hypothetical protein